MRAEEIEASSSGQVRARVVIVGAAGAVEQLTYAIPPELAQRIMPGHRVLVPMRSRRITGIVVEVGAALDSGGVEPKPILELLEPRPLFDRPHLELIQFLATYYMAPLGDAYRGVIPAAARVESRRMFQLGASPGPLALAAMNRLERSLLEALAKRPLTLKQIDRLGDRREVEAALARLAADGFVDRHDATRGRHRQSISPIVRIKAEGVPPPIRGPRQREIVRRVAAAGAAGIHLEHLEEEIAGAKAAVRAMVRRGIVELTAPEFAAPPRPTTESCGELALQANLHVPATRATVPPDGDPLPSPFELTWEQAAAVDAASPAVRAHRFEAFLLWGVTASGKTEVYLRLAADALAAGRQVLVLVPEIALADQVVRAFRRRFGALVAVAHSAQNVAERWASWMAALSGEARIMIGPRSAVFAPLHDAGLIVVDEEHDPAYKSEEGIRYHARDLAVALARASRCPVVLGSATPSAESYANARRGRYKLLRLSRRVGEREMAQVEIVDLREHLQARPNDPAVPSSAAESSERDAVPLSPPLINALRTNLAARGQSVVFLNRRGYHNFLQCHLCGNVIACRNCSVSMTFHLRDRSLRCHYCGASDAAPDKCPECAGFGLEGQGFGTERLVHALAEAIPDARIGRMDSDTSGRRGARTAMIDALARGELDILVGTQMITKGFDLPGVTLVGVVLADIALNLPDFRSAERTFQLLTQVAGRAGRGDRPGRVLIQTYSPHHYSIRAAREQDYARFMRRELELRRELMYPPFARMALVRIEGEDSARVSSIAAKAATALARLAQPDTMRVLGPAPAPIERIKQRYRWQVVVKCERLSAMRAALAAMRSEVAPVADREGVRLGIDIDPVNML
ncbi:MAG TPA: primosomal protein N' [Candidatus Binataceae bacterium]|nr:primosomal protein N' [Candidatus Binataceae bacterium]